MSVLCTAVHDPMAHRVHVFCGVLPLQPIEKRLKRRGVVRQILLLFDQLWLHQLPWP